MTESGNIGEQEAILLIRQGKTSAMKYIYEENIGYLTAVCSRYVCDDEDLRDVLQDSFIKIFTSIGGFDYRGKGSLRAWMVRIVINEALAFLKRNEKFCAVHFEANLPDVADEEEPDMENVPAGVIQEMIKGLPDGYRTVFNLYVFENKSHREIAELLDIKENTSASQLHKAKDMLARMIKEYKNKR